MTTQDLYQTRVSREPALIERHDPIVYGTAADGPLTQEQLDSHATYGYTDLAQLVSDSELATYQAELKRLLNDPTLQGDERVVQEKNSREIRSIFEVHRISEVFYDLLCDQRVAGAAQQILGSEVYIHQSRVNYKPGFSGQAFYWHSDFETWHAEDGLPHMRTVSLSLALTDNHDFNGSLMIMPGSHQTFVSCVGETPDDYYRESLQEQKIGTPDQKSLRMLAEQHGIKQFTGQAGSAVWFDCNCMHGSNGNITPFSRSNLFVVFNSVENGSVEPFSAADRRPTFLGSRDFTPVTVTR